MMKPRPEFKKRKVDGAGAGAPSHRTSSVAPQDDTHSAKSAKTIRDQLMVPVAAPTQNSSISTIKIEQAKNFAVSQARQECCTGNFRIFDSPFGNFLVPVIPTREELSK